MVAMALIWRRRRRGRRGGVDWIVSRRARDAALRRRWSRGGRQKPGGKFAEEKPPQSPPPALLIVMVMMVDVVAKPDGMSAVRRSRGRGGAFADESLDRGGAVVAREAFVDLVGYVDGCRCKVAVVITTAGVVVIQVDGTVFEIGEHAAKLVEVELRGGPPVYAASVMMMNWMIMMGDSRWGRWGERGYGLLEF